MRTAMLVAISYELPIGVEFHMPPHASDEYIEKTGRWAATQASELLALVLNPERAWECQQRRRIQKQELWRLYLVCGWGKEGQENTKPNAEKTPTDRNLSSKVCLGKYVEASNGQHEFCTSQTWSYKRLSSYGLACGSWLYELSGMQPWF